MKISIIVTTHKKPDYLIWVLNTLAEQSYDHSQFEIIVVPTKGDGSFNIVSNLHFDIKTICEHIPNDPFLGHNTMAKKNHGAKLASGEWLAFIDHDCKAHPDWLANAAKHFEEPNVAAIEGAIEFPDLAPPNRTYFEKKKDFQPGCYRTCNMFYKKEVFETLGGFNMNLPKFYADLDLAWSAKQLGKSILSVSDAKVKLPLPTPYPWKIVTQALHVSYKQFLYHKHNDQFTMANLTRFHSFNFVFIILYLLMFYALAWDDVLYVGLTLIALALVTSFRLVQLFAGFQFSFYEFIVSALFLPILPIIRIVQMIRGTILYRRLST